jgi:hypothetical protein
MIRPKKKSSARGSFIETDRFTGTAPEQASKGKTKHQASEDEILSTDAGKT